MTEILRLNWLTDADVFGARQRGREVASAVGLDRQDQVRVATALSEVCRELFTRDPSTVSFQLLTGPPRLLVAISTRRPTIRRNGGIDVRDSPASRLLDSFEVELAGDRIEVRMEKQLGRGSMLDPAAVSQALRAIEVQLSPLDELRVQNTDLIETLDALRRRQHELARLNEELEATNQGVMAMYTKLSDELDQTNRGVVALYAELDEKSRELATANEAKSRFLRNVSHELRAPVNSILGLAGLMMAGQLDSEQRRQVDYVLSSGHALLDLVNELLDLARAESNQLEVKASEVSLTDLLAALSGTLAPVAAARGVELVIDVPEVEVVVTDGDLLTRVLRNLLTNALAFTERGEVRVGSARSGSGSQVEITVRDTGIGIAPEHTERIFDEFFQVPNHLQAQRCGTGLGLPYTRQVTHALGGQLRLESTLGEGSTFTVALPLASEAGGVEAPPDIRVNHVVVLTHDPSLREALAEMLVGVSDRISQAADSDEAFAAIVGRAPDLLLLDLRMPDGGGADVLTALRTNPEPAIRDLPTILLTSVDIEANVRRAAEPAAAMLNTNALSRSTLARAIATVLSAPEEVP